MMMITAESNLDEMAKLVAAAKRNKTAKDLQLQQQQQQQQKQPTSFTRALLDLQHHTKIQSMSRNNMKSISRNQLFNVEAQQ